VNTGKYFRPKRCRPPLQTAGKNFLQANWHVITIVVTMIVIFCALVVVVDSMPPRATIMATGLQGGGYQKIGKEYQALLERAGEQLKLVETAGNLENLALLRDPNSGVKVALIQDGSISKDESGELASLGTLFYQPIWFFHRHEFQELTPASLRGRKISIGPVGSGARALLLELLKRNGLDQAVELFAFEPQVAADKLLAGDIDVAAFIAQWDAPAVQRLISDERVALANIPRADAYVALYPFLSKVTVPRGVGDLAKDLPPTDITLFAAKASLVVRKELHPAVQDLLLQAAVQIHSGPGMFQRAGHFPAAEGTDVSLSDEAIQFYKSGRPFLQSNFPFWMASLISRLIVVLIPIVTVLYPLMRFMPALYGWLMRSKIARLYGELRFLEDEIAVAGRSNTIDLIERLDRLEKQANQLRMPVAYESMIYLLRNQIANVRDRLRMNASPPPTR
jgi:TRAP-type uncharacterized transport system substrate-binding protein